MELHWEDLVITTSAAGRTWHYSHALGRDTAEHNGNVGGFGNPFDLAVSSDNSIFVLSRGFGNNTPGYYGDIGRRIGKMTIDELHIGDFARNELVWPVGIAISSDDKVYVSDEHQNLILVYPSEDTYPSFEFKEGGESIGRWGKRGSGAGQFNGPAGIAFDSKDNLFVVDKGNHRVQKYSKEGEFLLEWGSQGNGEGQFEEPWGVHVDQDGDVYVADWGNSRVQKFSPDGTHLLTFGSDEGGELDHPACVAVDSDGDVYVTDWGNGRVQVYEQNGDVITALYGDAHKYSKAAEYYLNRDPASIKTINTVDHAFAHTVRFERPVGIAVYPGNRIIITDSRGRLLVYDKDADYVVPNI